MDVGEAWNLLCSKSIAVCTGTWHCEMMGDRQVDCSSEDRKSMSLNHSEFLAYFSGCRFYELQAQDV